ncbi:MAG: hypothetical protein PHY08_11745 [Candidatus Cloacimonetes bacterium]|nr:hypothetical protein [Candidatus Cloacimonadota bacterium]
MINYGLKNDIRFLICSLNLIASILIYIVIDYFALSKISSNEQFELIINALKSLISIGLIFFILSFLFNRLLIKICNILYIDKKFHVVLKTNYKDQEIVGQLHIKIRFFKASIKLTTEKTNSTVESIYIDNEDRMDTIITYTYINDGNCSNKLNMHRGTCVIKMCKKSFIEGFYYNSPQRKTHGTINLIEENGECTQ